MPAHCATPGAVIVAALLLAPGLATPVRGQQASQGQAVTASAPDDHASSAPSATSLTAMAPELVSMTRRYFDFFGSPWHRHGGLLERSSLTGDWGGLRQDLVDKGIYVDVGLTQVFQANVGGGESTSEGLRYAGSLDYLINVDTDKLGLWPGGMWVVHGETSLGNNRVGGDAGTLLPVNFDGTMPELLGEDPGYTALSELYVLQALSPQLAIGFGKLNLASLADVNVFANNERTQFLYTGLVNDPILGSFAPYTPLAAAIIWMPDEHTQLALLPFLDTNGSVGRTGFDTAFSSPDGTTFGGQYARAFELLEGRPGNFRLIGAYTTKHYVSFAIDRRHFLEQAVGLADPIEEDSNYFVAINFDQYLFVRDKAKGIGWGLFGRGGWAPRDRNAIDQFYSFGIGGKGCLIPGRDMDQWGLGWAGTHLSDDLRDNLSGIGVDIKDFEHALEIFYNIEVTPATHLTLDAQYIINPAGAQAAGSLGSVADADRAIVLGMRLQVDF